MGRLIGCMRLVGSGLRGIVGELLVHLLVFPGRQGDLMDNVEVAVLVVGEFDESRMLAAVSCPG